MNKRKPTGFVAACQCSRVVGALDLAKTERTDAGKMLSRWLSDGCTVEPRFDGSWSVVVTPCACELTEQEF
ncbi:hypothetical protein HNQ50_000797 [Silvimonas terrae]|uniref:Uncharacterized protein n=1 Tax=Silvimonas terrae TaxID=300266 RepID=A0A840RB00_9NEIS|nr:hypothetical protein [Silvimonas terrae]MBB5190087.1 hypothetical protein [Silvimonas terrae]